MRSLGVALQAAERLGDSSGIAWAQHELGTLHLAAEDPAHAEQRFAEAQAIRRRLGDRDGLAATDHNLSVLCQRLRELLREEGSSSGTGGRVASSSPSPPRRCSCSWAQWSIPVARTRASSAASARGSACRSKDAARSRADPRASAVRIDASATSPVGPGSC